MATTPRKPQVRTPRPKAVAIEEVVPEIEVLENEGAPVLGSEEELVLLQEEAEATPEEKAPVDTTTYEVRFNQAHTLGNRVYKEGETAIVPMDHPFYGMSPQDQEEKYGKIHFVPLTD
jgi:hypothetical protein